MKGTPLRNAILITIMTIAISACNCFAQVPGKAFPFTEDEDRDGARMVWFLMNVSGLKATKHAYIPVKDIPKSNRWLKLKPDEPLQQIDMAWWPNAVAILMDTENKIYRFKADVVPLRELEKKFGKPEYRRFNTADKPLALVVFEENKKGPLKIPAILPETDLYAALFDLAINTTGSSCTHNHDDVWVSIADSDENKVYEIDHSGCITGEDRKVEKQFFELIKKMKEGGAFD
jgi:hypothetical protein